MSGIPALNGLIEAALYVDVELTRAWPRGGRSLYFRDPDHHLIELASPGIWPPIC